MTGELFLFQKTGSQPSPGDTVVESLNSADCKVVNRQTANVKREIGNRESSIGNGVLKFKTSKPNPKPVA